MATIATHNGSSVARAHNIRDPQVVTKEPHIRPGGEHEVWHDEKPRDAYERIFGAAVAAYNARQTRDDRKIGSYYDKIKADKQKHPVYEMIVGVYGDEVSDDQRKAILREYVAGWRERNPQLELIGAYWHADEQGQPHVHLDYIPVATGFRRGMSVQTGLKAALEQQGIEGQSPKLTAQMLWQRRENDTLESICRSHGIDVEHPERGKGVEHLEMRAYQARQDVQNALQTLESIQGDIDAAQSHIDALSASQRAIEQEIEATEAHLSALQTKKRDAEQLIEDVESVMSQGEKRRLPVSAKLFRAVTGFGVKLRELFSRERAVERRERDVAVREADVETQLRAATENADAARDDRAEARRTLELHRATIFPTVVSAVRAVLDERSPRGAYSAFVEWLHSRGAGSLVDEYEADVAAAATEKIERENIR